MSFAHPEFLWWLLLAPAPILLHLFFRRRKAKIDFSTLQFFHERRRELSMRRRLRELAILALRTLAAAALALAMAEPLSSGGLGLKSRTSAALVLDDSLSMDRRLASGGTAFSLAVEKAGEALSTLRSGDSAALVYVSGRKGLGFTRRLEDVRAELERASVAGAAGSYGAALARAGELLAADAAPNRECFVFSDFQKNQLPKRPFAFGAAGRSQGVRVYLLGTGGSPENLAIAPLKISPRPKTAGTPFSIPYIIRNCGAADRETTARLCLGSGPAPGSAAGAAQGAPAAALLSQRCVVPAGKSAGGVFDIVPDHAGTLGGYIEIADSALEADNRRFFALDIRESLGALLVETDPAGRIRPLHFFQAAIDPDPERRINGFRTETAFLEELTPKLLNGKAVVVLANPGPIPGAAAQLLMRYMESGGALVLFAGPGDSAATLAAFPDARIAGLMGARQAVNGSGCAFANGLAALNSLVDAGLLRWKALQRLALPEQGAELLATANANAAGATMPLIAELPVGNGRLVVSAASVRRDSSNWPELKSFPIAMIHLLAYATRDAAPACESECGRPAVFTPLAEGAKSISARGPDGVAATLAVEKGQAVFTEIWQPGLLTAQDARPGAVALNPAEAESDISGGSAEPPARLIGAASVSILRTDEDFARQVGLSRRGRDLAGLLLFIAILALLGETLLAAPKKPVEAD